jgi:hypothetical protein
MTENCARAVLRLIAVVTMMVGLCLIVFTFVGLLGASNAMGGSYSMVSQLGFYAVMAYGCVAALGLALFVFSPRLAALVVA